MYDRPVLRILSATLAIVLLSGCDRDRSIEPAAKPESASAYRAITDVKQTMERILDPAADVIWDSAGFVITAAGESDLAPTTDEGWEHVRDSAALVAESGNLLLMPGRVGGADWVVYAQELRTAGEVAMAAAEARDADALFDAGGRLYLACRTCHEQYMVPLEQARSAP